MALRGIKLNAIFFATIIATILAFGNFAKADFLRIKDIQDSGAVTLDPGVKSGVELKVGSLYNLYDQTGYIGTIKIHQIAKYEIIAFKTSQVWRAVRGGYYTLFPEASLAPKPATLPLKKGRVAPIISMKRANMAMFELDKDPLVGKEPQKGDQNRPKKKRHVEVVELHQPKSNPNVNPNYAGTIHKPSEEIVREKKAADTRAAERKEAEGEVPARMDLSSMDATTGFSLFPSARVIGKHRQRSRYTFSLSKADEVTVPMMVGTSFKALFKTKSHTLAFAYGLTTNIEIDYSYTAYKDNLRYEYQDLSGATIKTKEYDRTKRHALAVKTSLLGNEPGHARLSLFGREEFWITDGGEETENVFAGIVADIPFWSNKAELTAIYGVDSAFKNNEERYGAGLRMEFSDRMLASAEWYRQMPEETDSISSLIWSEERNIYAVSAQYRLDREYALNVSYENMRNFLWGSLDEGNLKTFRFSIVHSPN